MTGFMTDQLTIPVSVFADQPLRLAPEDFPNQAWSEQTAHYNRCWSYYKGYVLNKKNSKNVEIYPVKLNIVRSAVINHAAVLLGQFSDDGIVQFGIKNVPGITQETAKATSKAMSLLWAINSGDDLLLENALLSQIFGGTFWKVAWHPLRKKWPIRFFTADPRACFPVWDGDDYNRLVSIDVYHQIPRATAAVRYRMNLYGDMGVTTIEGQPDYVTVHEHWDEGEYFIKFDDQIGVWPSGQQMQGDNPFSDPVLDLPIIPYVYMPRIRAGEFWGDSVVSGLIGPQNTINNDLAHIEEGLADAMHQQPWVRNRGKGTQGLNKDRDSWINLGESRIGDKHQPEVGRLQGAEINQAMTEFVVDDLVMLSREHSNMPDVAYGRTDASIRSALTLKYMMWPAVNAAQHYRKHAATAFKHKMYHALVIAYSKRQLGSTLNGVSSLGLDAVTPEMIEAVLLGHKTNWPPMLPDDRADLVNEIVQRIASETISPETAIRRLDGSDELEEELNRIDEHRKKVQEREMEMQDRQHQRNVELAEKSGFKQQGDNGKSNKPPADRTTKAQAKGGRGSEK